MTRHYQSYLLRLWQTDDLENPSWRASLENPTTRQITGFRSLEDLCEFLLSRQNAPPDAAIQSDPSPQKPVHNR
jgi:hypothetical protein